MRAFNAIVVGVDLSAGSEESVAALVHAACALGAKRLHLVHVVQNTPVLPAPLRPEGATGEAARTAVDRATARLRVIDVPEPRPWVGREVRVGPPARELSRAAQEHRADLVVVARRGHNPLTRLVLGSVASGLIRTSYCPVLVIDEDQAVGRRFTTVLAAVDLSTVSKMVLENALMVARAHRGAVRVLSLMERSSGRASDDAPDVAAAERSYQDAVDALITSVEARGVECDSYVDRHKGPTPVGIVDVVRASQADVIVMGTSGRNAWHRMILGATAHHVLLRAPCAVLVVPGAVRVDGEDCAIEGLRGDPAVGGH